MIIITVGIDLAKNVFAVHDVNIHRPCTLYAQDPAEWLNPTIHNKFHDVVASALKFVGPNSGKYLCQTFGVWCRAKYFCFKNDTADMIFNLDPMIGMPGKILGWNLQVFPLRLWVPD